MKYLIFQKKPKYNEWNVLNKKKQYLGCLAFHKRWKRYAFYPDESPFEKDIYFCSMCLMEIVDKLEELNNKLKQQKEGKR